MKNNIYSIIAMAFMFLAVQLIALAIAPLYSATQSEAIGGRETIENPGFALVYLGIILVFTFVILWIAKKKKEKFIKILILFAIFMTMTYLFIPLTIAAIYPSEGGGWEYNEIGYDVVALNAGDIDDDGVVEIIAGCTDNRVRIYESENHTPEWESQAFPANISQILIGDVDFDGSDEFVILSDDISVFNGTTRNEKWSFSSGNITKIALGNVTKDNQFLIAGTGDARVFIMVNDTIYIEGDLSPYLDSIIYLESTDDQRIVASDGQSIALIDFTISGIEIDLTINELEDIRALTVYNNPIGEDYIIATDEDRAYLYNLSYSENIWRSKKKLSYFKKSPEIYSIQLVNYSIPDCDDTIPDVVVIGKRVTIIFPDLLDNEKRYRWLTYRADVHAFLSTDLDGDDTKEWILGIEDGYIYTSIDFDEGPNLLIPFVIAIICSLSLTLLVHKFPEWYVVDVVGVVMAIGAVVILGVTFAILPAVVLLIILAVYDAISVYKTKHMISLADSVIELNLPVLLVIPKKLGYSYRKEKPRLKEQLESGEEREAMFMGLGDIVIPSLLVVSALAFLPTTESVMGITGNMLVAFGTMIGILCGFSILMRFVMKGNPQAGLPLLNSGALLGYFITYILIYQDYGFGFNLNFM